MIVSAFIRGFLRSSAQPTPCWLHLAYLVSWLAVGAIPATALTCKRGSVGQSEGLSIPRSSVRFRLNPDNTNSHEFELHRSSNKGTKPLLKVIKAIIIINATHCQKVKRPCEWCAIPANLSWASYFHPSWLQFDQPCSRAPITFVFLFKTDAIRWCTISYSCGQRGRTALNGDVQLCNCLV